MIDFTITGEKPQPAGSKKAFVNRKTGGVIVTDANKNLKPWKAVVEAAASKAMGNLPLAEGPLRLEVHIFLGRPGSHLKLDGTLSAMGERNPFPTKRPDLLKLVRGIEDAMTGVVYHDDAQIIEQFISKRYDYSGEAENNEVRILVTPIR